MFFRDLKNHLSIQADPWATKTHRVEARGVYADSFDSLKPKAFPTLMDRAPMNNSTLEETVEFIYDAARNYTQFSTAGAFLSYELSPEGAKLIEETYGFNGHNDYMQAINLDSYRKYLEKKYYVISESYDYVRPKKGMSELITNLVQRVRSRGAKIYLKETVASVDKTGDKFVEKAERKIMVSSMVHETTCHASGALNVLTFVRVSEGKVSRKMTWRPKKTRVSARFNCT